MTSFLPLFVCVCAQDCETHTYTHTAMCFDPHHHHSALKGNAFHCDVSSTQPCVSVVSSNSFYVKMEPVKSEFHTLPSPPLLGDLCLETKNKLLPLVKHAGQQHHHM